MEKVPHEQRKSFAPTDALIDFMSSGYDPHYLIFKTLGSTAPLGLVAFNVDTMVQK
jgi:hypothetical protein